jgi:hypothetical protein
MLTLKLQILQALRSLLARCKTGRNPSRDGGSITLNGGDPYADPTSSDHAHPRHHTFLRLRRRPLRGPAGPRQEATPSVRRSRQFPGPRRLPDAGWAASQVGPFLSIRESTRPHGP